MPTIVHGPAWTTVTGTWLPSAPKIWVMPTLRPMSASFRAIRILGGGLRPPSEPPPRDCAGKAGARTRPSQLDLHIDTSREIEFHERVDGLRRGIHDVEQTLVGAHLELLTRGLVDVRRAQHRPAIDDGRQQHRARDASARAPYGLDDLLDRPIQEMMIVGLQPDANLLIG